MIIGGNQRHQLLEADPSLDSQSLSDTSGIGAKNLVKTRFAEDSTGVVKVVLDHLLPPAVCRLDAAATALFQSGGCFGRSDPNSTPRYLLRLFCIGLTSTRP